MACDFQERPFQISSSHASKDALETLEIGNRASCISGSPELEMLEILEMSDWLSARFTCSVTSNRPNGRLIFGKQRNATTQAAARLEPLKRKH